MRKIFMLTAVFSFVATGPALAEVTLRLSGKRSSKNAKPAMLSDAEKECYAARIWSVSWGAARVALESYKKYSKAMKASGIVWDDRNPGWLSG